MAKASVLQSSFSSGEVSPLYFGQSATPKYKSGVEKCLNYIPTIQGPLIRRPSTAIVGVSSNAESPAQNPTLIPFKFSVTQNYMLEVGDKYIRFWTNGALISTTGSYNVIGIDSTVDFFTFWATRPTLTPFANEIITSGGSPVGGVLSLVTPYAIADVPLIRYAQSNDTLYLVHPNYPLFKLQRYGEQSWTLRRVRLNDGPFLPLNSYQFVGDSTLTTVGVTAQSTPNYFTLTTNQVTSSAITGAANNGSGLIRITLTSHGLSTGQSVYIFGVGGCTEANNYSGGFPSNPWSWSIIVIDANNFDLIGSSFVHAWTSGGTVFTALFSSATAFQPGGSIAVPVDNCRSVAVYIAGIRYYGFVSFVLNASSATIWIDPANKLASSGAVATAWQLGVYSPANGYPACVTLHQDRLVLAATPGYPQEVDFSMTGNYEYFSASTPATLSVNDNDAMQFTLNSSDSNSLQWLATTAQGLQAGSSSAEWLISPSTQAEALTPTNFNAQQMSYYGSAPINCAQLGNATVFVQRMGRKVRELTYFFQLGTFRATDVSELSEHLPLPSIIQLAVQKESQPLMWALRSDGALLSMTYNREDASVVAGWAEHVLGGYSDLAGSPAKVTSIACMPSPDGTYDQLWMVVTRYPQSLTASLTTLEVLTPIDNNSILQEDATCLDCQFTYDVPLTITAIATGTTTVITSAAHGLSVGASVRLSDIIGITTPSTDANGNVTYTSLLNNLNFTLTSVTTNTFTIAIDTSLATSYISGGFARKFVTSIALAGNSAVLAGDIVGVLTDGGIHPDVLVAVDGSIKLQYPAAKVHYGLRYKSQGKLLRLDAGSPQGTAIGATRRTHKAAFQLRRTGDLSIGTRFSSLMPVSLTQADVNLLDQGTPLYSGIIREDIESQYDFESQIHFEQSSPLTGTIQSISIFMEEFDV